MVSSSYNLSRSKNKNLRLTEILNYLKFILMEGGGGDCAAGEIETAFP